VVVHPVVGSNSRTVAVLGMEKGTPLLPPIQRYLKRQKKNGEQKMEVCGLFRQARIARDGAMYVRFIVEDQYVESKKCRD
jgi:cytochrome c-type biogenesis protein CcmE